MHLEKATSRSSEAALAGWISSNDATLFTTVLVVVIAMFLYSNLERRSKENLQIVEEKETLSAQLLSTTGELDSSKDLLEQTAQALNLTQEQRDQLRQQLNEKLEAMSRLDERLAAVLEEKSQLESQSQSLAQEKESLLAQRATLAQDRESLSTANVSLRERLESITGRLEEKIAALEQLEHERDRLKAQADELSAIVATLQQKMKELNIELTETRAQATDLSVASDQRIQRLESELAARDRKAEEYLADLKRATALFQGLKQEKQQLEHTLTVVEARRQEELLEEIRNNRELVGLKGQLDRVAIVFDASGSMKLSAGGAGRDRWAEAQDIVANWLQHLNVQQCALIVFSNEVRTFPRNGSLADLRGEDGKLRRQALLQQLRSLTPNGWTDTLAAMQKAYEYDVDAILLFTDGAPSKDVSGHFDPALAQQVYQLCGQHKNVPVHTIGLGNYFDQDMSTFLLSVSSITGGTFRGQ
jgi:hypothetical protein